MGANNQSIMHNNRILIKTWILFVVSVFLCAPFSWAETAEAEEPPVLDGGEPAWLARPPGEFPADREDPDYRKATWRSMGILILLVGALVGTRHLFSRRAPVWARPATSLRVVGRLRLGLRQELVLVEWEGEQLALGVGSSFIRCLHVRPVPTGDAGQDAVT